MLNGSVAVSYALDLFGANRHAIEGLKAQREQKWQLEGARLMLAGNVVSAAIRQAQLQADRVDDKLLEVERKELKITGGARTGRRRLRFRCAQPGTLWHRPRRLIPPLQLEMDIVDDQLAVLMGNVPGGRANVERFRSRSRLPEELPLTLPSELVRQRPDIRAAEALLHEASANVGVARANVFPQIVLTGSGGGFGTNFTSGGDVWNVGGSLTPPIFNGGALQAEKRKAEDATRKREAYIARPCSKAFQDGGYSLCN